MFDFGGQSLDSDCPLQDSTEFIPIVGFGEVREGSLGQLADCAVGAGIGGENDDGELGLLFV